jgi:hypothetical protein
MTTNQIYPSKSAFLWREGALFISRKETISMDANDNNHTNSTKISEQLFSEAPASWNTRYLDPHGFECQITLRCDTGQELLEKAASAIAYLLKNGCLPYVYRSPQRPVNAAPADAKNGNDQSNGTNGNNGTNANPGWCPIHQCEMKRWDKDGRVWYSHKVDNKWCSGK